MVIRAAYVLAFYVADYAHENNLSRCSIIVSMDMPFPNRVSSETKLSVYCRPQSLHSYLTTKRLVVECFINLPNFKTLYWQSPNHFQNKKRFGFFIHILFYFKASAYVSPQTSLPQTTPPANTYTKTPHGK